ncbi:MAG: extracellular solute-binding protein [Lachnospiraceae bacterium]|nr:extracellular solute-binding protein [Lachnospiraceae bacterium]
MNKLKRFFQDFYLVLVLIFLYAPIAVMMVLSFNSSKSRSQWGGFTTQWYREMFESPVIMEALYNTLIIAFLSALIATILGTAAAIGISSMKKLPRTIFMGINNIPMLNSDIVTGISLMLMFVAFGVSLGFKTILFAHITFNVPYVMTSVLPKLKQTSKYTYEAAMDLGAGPIEAFFKVVFPDILPGVLSGFLMAFTMSLDDFIITHFTKGAGINTLSTLIYSEVRRGIKPSMYALSTVIFVTVLALLLITNFAPSKAQMEAKAAAAAASGKKPNNWGPKLYKAVLVATSFLIVCGISYTTYRHFDNSNSDELYVYNWGEYIDESVIEQFEEETGIKVTYDMFETNEEMYPIIEAGAVQYDVVCPSDYMIQKMRENDLLMELNLENIPNLEYIDQTYLEKSQSFDPQNKYSVPYTWGTVGIIYNTKRLEELGIEPPTKWSDLWDPRYKGEILMQDSVRDAFMVALKMQGHSLNSTDMTELEDAKNLLLDQKPLVQAYVVDQVRDKMLNGEAAVGVIYSGELLYLQEEAELLELDYELKYVIPEEGSNVWIDAWVIPYNAQNKENAEKWIDFLCRPEIALKNFEYITYATPNIGAFEMLDEETQNNKSVFPDDELLESCEVYQYLGTEADDMYSALWKEIKAQ